jgi:hypothetical protein
MHKRVAIDFDGTLFEDLGNIDSSFENNTNLPPIDGASGGTQWLKDNGFEILIYTCRPDYHREYIQELCKANNIAFDYILFYTKPRVSVYIDDKAVGYQNWNVTLEEIKNKFNL